MIEKNGVAAYCIEETSLNCTVLGSFQENSSLAVDRPISARRRFVTFQKCAFGMSDAEAGQVDVVNRLSLGAAEFDGR